MVLTDYVNSTSVNSEIETYIKDEKNFDKNRKIQELKSIVSNAYNYGAFSIMNDRKASQEKTMLSKSKEVTAYFPDNFKKSEMGKQLNDLIMASILTNSQGSVLNIGYEEILPDDISRALQIAYAIGLSVGFDISSDPDLKSIYQSNIERFLKHGAGNNV